jgi:hypothetical protein
VRVAVAHAGDLRPGGRARRPGGGAGRGTRRRRDRG